MVVESQEFILHKLGQVVPTKAGVPTVPTVRKIQGQKVKSTLKVAKPVENTFPK